MSYKSKYKIDAQFFHSSVLINSNSYLLPQSQFWEVQDMIYDDKK